MNREEWDCVKNLKSILEIQSRWESGHNPDINDPLRSAVIGSIRNDFNKHYKKKRHVTTGKNHCNNYKVVAIRCYCNDKKATGSCCNKLRDNRFMQQKNLIAINFTYCNNLWRR